MNDYKIPTIVTLSNGRVFRIVDTGKPYINQEYPEGGFHISTQLPNSEWVYTSHSPDIECVESFLGAIDRIPVRMGKIEL